MQPLIADMVQEDPTRRPNMDEVVSTVQALDILICLVYYLLFSRSLSYCFHAIANIMVLNDSSPEFTKCSIFDIVEY